MLKKIPLGTAEAVRLIHHESNGEITFEKFAAAPAPFGTVEADQLLLSLQFPPEDESHVPGAGGAETVIYSPGVLPKLNTPPAEPEYGPPPPKFPVPTGKPGRN